MTGGAGSEGPGTGLAQPGCQAAEQPDGLLYPSRLLPRGSSLALYEHCSDAWCEEPLGDLMHWRGGNGEPAVLEILDAHGWGLVD